MGHLGGLSVCARRPEVGVVSWDSRLLLGLVSSLKAPHPILVQICLPSPKGIEPTSCFTLRGDIENGSVSEEHVSLQSEWKGV